MEVNLVEISSKLVKTQRDTLKCGTPVIAASSEGSGGDVVMASMPDGKPVYWHWLVRSVNDCSERECIVLIVGCEVLSSGGSLTCFLDQDW